MTKKFVVGCVFVESNHRLETFLEPGNNTNTNSTGPIM
jgi:hypothetical protein